MFWITRISSRFLSALLGIFLIATIVRAAEVMPPKPENHFNDYTGKISPVTVTRLNSLLQDFERETSSQIVVAVFRKMQSDSSLEDYAQRIYQSWGIGRKGANNGTLLLVFVEDRKMRIQTGYGLEGVLPDATCKQIIDGEIKPHFQRGDFDGGLEAGITAILQATKGEYKGSGRTVRDENGGTINSVIIVFWFFVGFVFLSLILRSFGRRGRVYGRGGSNFGSWSSGGWGGSSGSSGWSGGGSFSGGGGSSGGGGASGSW